MNKKELKRHKNRAYQERRRRNNPQFKILHNLRKRQNRALKNILKYAKTSALLGCSLDDFKIYLEKQFKSNMTWENYGKVWEIDHIIPCCEWNLFNPEEQKMCFHYTNLQPLYVSDNRKKSKKLVN